MLLVAASCATNDTGDVSTEPLNIQILDDTTIAGTFVHGSTVVEFVSQSPDQQYGTLSLSINGANIDVEIDLANGTYQEDGYLNALYAPELEALAALRDAVQEAHPDLVLQTLQGKLLARHADRLAEAPAGFTFDHRVVDLAAARASARAVDRADADGCGGDGATCLPGTDGWAYAVFDQGDDGTCWWWWRQYGEHEERCRGRCGEGCNHWFDDDYTWDCLDHDWCVYYFGGSSGSGNSNCGDEYWEAADDYALTYGPYC
ncbi:MAG: hypothetical protein D6689_08415 [Deltaproteobacteria bacterium]|nr:MAG: hypothetical protein D6689_08415 [Deltaproteobacteria bacterium]